MGMASALGVRFLDQFDQEVELGGGQLNQITSIDITQLDPRLTDVEIVIATDVNNPLIGPHGATYIFGPQKGATPDMLLQLEANLCHFADIIQQTLGISLHHVKGAGAAGGLAAGLMAFTTAKFSLVLKQSSNLFNWLRKFRQQITFYWRRRNRYTDAVWKNTDWSGAFSQNV